MTTATATPPTTKPPAFATTPKADPPVCPTDTCTLTALGADDDGKLVYTWNCLWETRPVKFSANGTNAAKRTTATFPAPGMYTLECELRAEDGQVTVARCSVVIQPYVIEIVEGVSFGSPDTIVRCFDEHGSLYAMSGQPGNRPHLVRAVVNLWNDRKLLQEQAASFVAKARQMQEENDELRKQLAALADKKAESPPGQEEGRKRK